jgi:hypothetical protein
LVKLLNVRVAPSFTNWAGAGSALLQARAFAGAHDGFQALDDSIRAAAALSSRG